MRTGVDTNIFSRMWRGGPDAAAMQRTLKHCAGEGTLTLCPVVYAEMLANPVVSPQIVNRFLKESGTRVDYRLQPEVWMDAGLRYGAYAQRRRESGGGESRRLVADFLVGSHAWLQADRLLTLDTQRFRVDYPELVLVEMRA